MLTSVHCLSLNSAESNVQLECLICIYACLVSVTGLNTKKRLVFRLDWSLWLETMGPASHSKIKNLLCSGTMLNTEKMKVRLTWPHPSEVYRLM